MSGRGPVPYLTRYSRFKTVSTSGTTQYGSFGNGSGGKEDIAAIYVGTAADVTVTGSDGVAVTFKAPPAGTVLHISPVTISAGSDLIALYW